MDYDAETRIKNRGLKPTRIGHVGRVNVSKRSSQLLFAIVDVFLGGDSPVVY